jgi:hypothetical protein
MTSPAEEATVKLMQLFRPFVGMLLFAPDNPEPSSVRFNGTASFVVTGIAKIIVTNGHVYKRFMELKQQEPSLKMFITGAVPNQILELREEYLVWKERRGPCGIFPFDA